MINSCFLSLGLRSFQGFKCFYSVCLIIHGLSVVIFVTDFLHPFCWIINAPPPPTPFSVLRVQEELTLPGVQTLSFCSDTTRGQEWQLGCDWWLVFPSPWWLDPGSIYIYSLNRCLRKHGNHFTSQALLFDLHWRQHPKLSVTQTGFWRRMTMPHEPSGKCWIWRIIAVTSRCSRPDCVPFCKWELAIFSYIISNHRLNPRESELEGPGVQLDCGDESVSGRAYICSRQKHDGKILLPVTLTPITTQRIDGGKIKY